MELIEMTKGGARTRSGPAPDPNALARERDAGEWVELPASGRTEAAPMWPLTDATDREVELWKRLWAMPQAFMWARFSQEIEVALYVRRLGESERPRSPIILGTLVRQMADSLGLTTPGLRCNKWKIVTVGVVAVNAGPGGEAGAPRASSRTRFTVVAGDGAA